MHLVAVEARENWVFVFQRSVILINPASVQLLYLELLTTSQEHDGLALIKWRGTGVVPHQSIQAIAVFALVRVEALLSLRVVAGVTLYQVYLGRGRALHQGLFFLLLANVNDLSRNILQIMFRLWLLLLTFIVSSSAGDENLELTAVVRVQKLLIVMSIASGTD